MKHSYKFKRRFGRKNLIMCIVALVLVMTTVVSVSYSWIEEISKVEFSTDDNEQESPYQISGTPLKANAGFANQNREILLANYFNKSGDLHLSPCYSDGETFYFPVESKSGGSDMFRLGTKDDVNTNYIQATFKAYSQTADTAYWFEKIDEGPFITMENSLGSSNVNSGSGSSAESYLRVSVTVDGSTSVYALNSSGKFNKVSGISGSVSKAQGRSLEKYQYCNFADIADMTANAVADNQAGNNLNGNTLFTIPKSDQPKTVTIKIWLEYNGSNVKDVRLSNINLKLTSSWAKTRRIYILDRTVAHADHTPQRWLYENGAKMYWAYKDNLSTPYEVPKSTKETISIGGSSYSRYYIDVPAVYNNEPVVLFRCPGNYNQSGGTTYDPDRNDPNNATIKCWDYWETAFPDTFHNETFSIYTNVFGTWEEVARHVEIINSCHFTYNNVTQFAKPFAYMWDSSTDTGAPDRVVQNSSWPGVEMTKLDKQKSNLDVYAFYYNSIFDRIVFNDNYNPSSAAYQTQDINLDQAKSNPQYYDGKVYDMATLKWYNSFNDLPTYSDYCVYGNFFVSDDENRMTHTRMVVNPNNTNELYCRVYVRYQSSNNEYYTFKIKKNDASEWWGFGHYNTNEEYWYIDGQMSGSSQPTLTNDSSNDLRLHATNTASYTDANNNQHPGIYGIYYNKNTHKLWVQKENP